MGRTTPTGTANGLPVLKRPATKDHLDSRERAWQVVEVCTSQKAMHDLSKIQALRDAASMEAGREGASAEAKEALASAERELAKVQKAVEEATRECLFVGVGGAEYKRIIDKHTITPEASDNGAEETLTQDVDAVNLELIAASMVIPENVTPEDVERWKTAWGPTEFQVLLAATIVVNTESQLVRLGGGSTSRRVARLTRA